jgi:hypothetical protein
MQGLTKRPTKDFVPKPLLPMEFLISATDGCYLKGLYIGSEITGKM